MPSIASSAPLWHHIITDVTKGTPIEKFKRPNGIVEVEVDAWSGLRPGPGTQQTVTELFIDGTQEGLRRDDMHSARAIDGATGLLWDEGCTGPKEQRYFLDFSNVESRFPKWQRANQGWAERAARGSGVYGGPKRTPTSYFFDGFLVPFGRTWGGRFAPTKVCTVPATDLRRAGRRPADAGAIGRRAVRDGPAAADDGRAHEARRPEADEDPRTDRQTMPRDGRAASCRERCSRSPCPCVLRDRAPAPTEPPNRRN